MISKRKIKHCGRGVSGQVCWCVWENPGKKQLHLETPPPGCRCSSSRWGSRPGRELLCLWPHIHVFPSPLYALLFCYSPSLPHCLFFLLLSPLFSFLNAFSTFLPLHPLYTLDSPSPTANPSLSVSFSHPSHPCIWPFWCWVAHLGRIAYLAVSVLVSSFRPKSGSADTSKMCPKEKEKNRILSKVMLHFEIPFYDRWMGKKGKIISPTNNQNAPHREQMWNDLLFPIFIFKQTQWNPIFHC